MRRDAQANRERVLAAADEVFSEYGRAGSTEEIARRAGVGIGTVFRHFPTKDLLVEATIVRLLGALNEAMRARGHDDAPGAAFRTTFREMVFAAPAKLRLLTLLPDTPPTEASTPATNRGPAAALAPGTADLSTVDPRTGATDLVQTAETELCDAIEVLLRRGQDTGELRPDATVDEVFVLVRALASTGGDRTVMNRAVDLVLDGFSPRSRP